MSKAAKGLLLLIFCCFVLLSAFRMLRAGNQPTEQAVPKYSEWSQPVSLGTTINSKWDDALPAMSKDGLSLYFSSNRDGFTGSSRNFDIWVSQRSDESAPWGPPINLGPLVNTGYLEAGPALSRDGHWLLFHSDRPGELHGINLMASWRQHTNDDFGWQEPIMLGSVINSDSDDAGPTYFEGEEDGVAELYFGSTRPGGLGSWDIYVSRLGIDGVFGPPVLVVDLSSSAADQRPAISHDGRKIFFHSNRAGSIVGLNGMPSNDIWVSTRETVLEPWTTPVNVAEVNTAYGESQPTISSDGMTLIITSNRPGGLGATDLYVATRSKLHGRR